MEKVISCKKSKGTCRSRCRSRLWSRFRKTWSKWREISTIMQRPTKKRKLTKSSKSRKLPWMNVWPIGEGSWRRNQSSLLIRKSSRLRLPLCRRKSCLRWRKSYIKPTKGLLGWLWKERRESHKSVNKIKAESKLRLTSSQSSNRIFSTSSKSKRKTLLFSPKMSYNSTKPCRQPLNKSYSKSKRSRWKWKRDKEILRLSINLMTRIKEEWQSAKRNISRSRRTRCFEGMIWIKFKFITLDERRILIQWGSERGLGAVVLWALRPQLLLLGHWRFHQKRIQPLRPQEESQKIHVIRLWIREALKMILKNVPPAE